MGRNKKELDYKLLDGILQYNASKAMCADILDVSEDTIDRRIKEDHKTTFKEYRERKLSVTKVNLQKKAINKALNGDNTMLIFCLKNLCHWADKVETEQKSEQTIINIGKKQD